MSRNRGVSGWDAFNRKFRDPETKALENAWASRLELVNGKPTGNMLPKPVAVNSTGRVWKFY